MESGRLTWRQKMGLRAENAAAAHLQLQGAHILLRNYRCRSGELDIVARLGQDELVIVEVRTRSSDAYGGAAASIDVGKRRRLIRAANRMLQERRDLAKLRVRFDVMLVFEPASDRPQIIWIKHAFST